MSVGHPEVSNVDKGIVWAGLNVGARGIHFHELMYLADETGADEKNSAP